jgi:hypothetical protein
MRTPPELKSGGADGLDAGRAGIAGFVAPHVRYNLPLPAPAWDSGRRRAGNAVGGRPGRRSLSYYRGCPTAETPIRWIFLLIISPIRVSIYVIDRRADGAKALTKWEVLYIING